MAIKRTTAGAIMLISGLLLLLPGPGNTAYSQAPPETVFMLAGTGGNSALVSGYLRGEVTKGKRTVPISYPNQKKNIDADMLEGARILNEKLTTTQGKKTVFAHSLGAVVSSAWLKQYGPTSAINPAELEFIFIGNSVRPYNGYYPLNNWTQTNGKPFVNKSIVSPIGGTRYKVEDIAIQYDGWADWPNIKSVTTAISNASGGMIVYHLMYDRFPRTRADYRKYTEGNITYTLIPVNQWWSSASYLTKVETGYTRPM